VGKRERKQYLDRQRRRRTLAYWDHAFRRLDRRQTFIRFVINPLLVLGAALALGLANHDVWRVVGGVILGAVVFFEAVAWRSRRPPPGRSN